MPEKVIGGGFLVPGAAEVNVPSWTEFKEAIDRLWQEFGYVNANKQELWDAINQLKGDPAADIQSELRRVRDAAYSAHDMASSAGKRLDTVEKHVSSIQTDAKTAFRAVIDETLHPIFQYGLDQAIRRLMTLEEENRRLRSDLESLRSEVQRIRGG